MTNEQMTTEYINRCIAEVKTNIERFGRSEYYEGLLAGYERILIFIDGPQAED
jgi:hypothetical protein